MRTRPGDIAIQAFLAITGRKLRATLTLGGIALGVAAAVATVGVTSSANGAISKQFDLIRATQITAQYSLGTPMPQPRVVEAVRALNGVQSAGLLASADSNRRLATVSDAAVQKSGTPVPVFAAQPAALQTLNIRLASGRWPDAGNAARHDAVVMIEATLARSLPALLGGAVYLEGHRFSIIGTFYVPSGQARFVKSAIIPYEFALASRTANGSGFASPEVAIRVKVGAADQVGTETPLALWPERPSSVNVLLPPDLRSFRQGIEGQTRILLIGLAIVSLVIGALGVSNTMLVSVLERRSEIGLRRAVGTSRSGVASQFLIESILLGTGGGLLGAIVGLDVTAAICKVNQWQLVLEPWLLAAAPAVGCGMGIFAGIYPAWSASRIPPAASLRS